MPDRELMEKAELTTFRAHREARELSFAKKSASLMDRFSRWFPKHESSTNNRGGLFYREFFVRCGRCHNSPLYNVRRRLNRDIVGSGARERRTGKTERTARM